MSGCFVKEVDPQSPVSPCDGSNSQCKTLWLPESWLISILALARFFLLPLLVAISALVLRRRPAIRQDSQGAGSKNRPVSQLHFYEPLISLGLAAIERAQI